ncbi:MAG: hypothetical protein ABW157_18590 [Candidatus Thiodiazotropha sp. LLP2]
MTKVTPFRLLTVVLFLLACVNANSVEMRHNFTLTGDNGETGSGFLTWDDAVILDGNNLPFLNVISGSLTVNGGTTPGGTQTFAIGDWTNAVLNLTPNFAADINILANNGAESLTPAFPYINNASWGSTLTFAPGATVLATPPAAPRAIPLLDSPGLIIISLLLALTGLWHVNRQSTRRP